MYRRNVNKGFIRGIYKGSIYITWGTSKNHIGLRLKVCGSILKSFYSKIRNLNGDFNGILFIDKQANRKVKLDAKAVSMSLC